MLAEEANHALIAESRFSRESQSCVDSRGLVLAEEANHALIAESRFNGGSQPCVDSRVSS